MTNDTTVSPEIASVMAPSYPRRVGYEDGDEFKQVTVDSTFELTHKIDNIDETSDKFISVYSFPDGHPSNGNNPLVDTIFFDFDIRDDHIYRLTGDPQDWYDAIDELLMVVSEIAHRLLEKGADIYWRASLSGHKGVHLYLDFEALPTKSAPFSQYKVGLNNFVSETIESLNQQIPLDVTPYVDADSADLARLCRFPNTTHPDACRKFEEYRYCVPVSIKELATMDADDYIHLTQQPRLPDEWVRNSTNETIRSSVRQNIFDALVHSEAGGGDVEDYGGAEFKRSRITAYKERNDGKFDEVDDIWWKLNGTPCIKQYLDRDDQFDHGGASHMFELFIMTHMVDAEIPYDIIVEYFSEIEGFSPVETKGRLNQIIGRSYSPVNCEKIWQKAPQFCINNGCDLYNRTH